MHENIHWSVDEVRTEAQYRQDQLIAAGRMPSPTYGDFSALHREMLGVAGEMTYSRAYDVPMRPWEVEDPGFDFEHPYRLAPEAAIRVDVKGNGRPDLPAAIQDLSVDPADIKRMGAHFYVLAMVDVKAGWGYLAGCATWMELRTQEPTRMQHGTSDVLMHRFQAPQLHPMSWLEELWRI